MSPELGLKGRSFIIYAHLGIGSRLSADLIKLYRWLTFIGLNARQFKVIVIGCSAVQLRKLKLSLAGVTNVEFNYIKNYFAYARKVPWRAVFVSLDIPASNK